jgi:hypothetical protein
VLFRSKMLFDQIVIQTVVTAVMDTITQCLKAILLE